MSIFIRWI